jgi:hypothetical protein
MCVISVCAISHVICRFIIATPTRYVLYRTYVTILQSNQRYVCTIHCDVIIYKRGKKTNT